MRPVHLRAFNPFGFKNGIGKPHQNLIDPPPQCARQHSDRAPKSPTNRRAAPVQAAEPALDFPVRPPPPAAAKPLSSAHSCFFRAKRTIATPKVSVEHKQRGLDPGRHLRPAGRHRLGDDKGQGRREGHSVQRRNQKCCRPKGPFADEPRHQHPEEDAKADAKGDQTAPEHRARGQWQHLISAKGSGKGDPDRNHKPAT